MQPPQPAPRVVTVAYHPRYDRHSAAVISAVRRTVYDNGGVTIDLITADTYRRATDPDADADALARDLATLDAAADECRAPRLPHRHPEARGEGLT